jgi:hypothetical protein
MTRVDGADEVPLVEEEEEEEEGLDEELDDEVVVFEARLR